MTATLAVRNAAKASAAMTEAEALRLARLTEACRGALDAVWLDLNPDTAERYRRALVDLVETQRANHPWEQLSGPRLVPFPQIGPYRLLRVLGAGSSGMACLGQHVDSGQRATVKLNAGAEGDVFDALGGILPPQFVRIYEHGVFDDPVSGAQWPWVAREYADGGTWADERYSADIHVGNQAEALEVFRLACQGVAALHAAGVQGWSAHQRNVLRTADGWRLADLGRCTIVRTGAERLQMDDVAGLGGLLLDVLETNRWATFLQFLTGRKRYTLTGTHQVDRALSKVLNRAWLGDCGGALAVAAGQPWDTGYSDPRELLADVEAALLPRHNFALSAA